MKKVYAIRQKLPWRRVIVVHSKGKRNVSVVEGLPQMASSQISFLF